MKRMRPERHLRSPPSSPPGSNDPAAPSRSKGVVEIVTILFFLVTFLVAALAVLLASLALHRGQSPAETPQTLLKEESISTIGIWGSVLERFDFINMLRRHLDQADLAWSVGRFTGLML